MFLADGDNNSIWTVAMKEWDVVDTFKVSSDAAANTVLHKIVTDFARLSQSRLDDIALRLNQRPRKTLDFETPADRLRAVLQ